MTKGTKFSSIIPCSKCKANVNLTEVSKVAEMLKTREIKCPYCSHTIGKLN